MHMPYDRFPLHAPPAPPSTRTVISGKGINVPAGGAVTYEKHHASDWLPTLVSMAAGEDWKKHIPKDEPPYLLGDGVNNWPMLSSGGKTPSGEAPVHAFIWSC